MQQNHFVLKLVGTGYHPAYKEYKNQIRKNAYKVFCQREPENEYDPNAIRVFVQVDGIMKPIGYIAKGLAEIFAGFFKEGLYYEATLRNQNRYTNIDIIINRFPSFL